MMPPLTKETLQHFGNTPMAALLLFEDSFVALEPDGENQYAIHENGIPAIHVAPYGDNADIALFHELGHFNATSQERLLKHNFGLSSGQELWRGGMKGYADVLHELKVLALEWNLMMNYQVRPETPESKYVNWLYVSMPGGENFRQALGLEGDKAIHAELHRRWMEYRQQKDFTFVGFLQRWEERNAFLKTKLGVTT